MENAEGRSDAEFRDYRVKVTGGDVHVVEAGSEADPVVLFLHGFPQSWRAFEGIMWIARGQARAVAIDLPGVGASKVADPPGDKRSIAKYVHEVVQALNLRDITLVGHDAGGMVAFAYLTSYSSELKRLVIMDTVIPGIDPWNTVVQNPYVWHFRFHAIPELPEKLIMGKQEDYFAYFFDTISAHPEAISREARQEYAQAYAESVALSAGISWYRAFEEDAKVNSEFAGSSEQIETPVLYLRGEREGGKIEQYIEGFQKAGLKQVAPGIVPDSGHFAPEEQPEEVWKLIASFMQLAPR